MSTDKPVRSATQIGTVGAAAAPTRMRCRLAIIVACAAMWALASPSVALASPRRCSKTQSKLKRGCKQTKRGDKPRRAQTDRKRKRARKRRKARRARSNRTRTEESASTATPEVEVEVEVAADLAPTQSQAPLADEPAPAAAGDATTTAAQVGDGLAAVQVRGRARIDGVLDESHWQAASPATNFTQKDPDEGKRASEQTTVRVAYDRDALHIAVEASDSNPGKILAPLAPRDREVTSDWIHVAIDSYGDGITAYEFAINPSEVKLDARWSPGAGRELTWNGIWEGAARRTPTGWVAELRIPFDQLRFTNKSSVWGLQVWRKIARKNEVVYWRRTPRDADNPVQFYGRLTGLDGIVPPRTANLRPYVLLRTADDDRGITTRLGADFKYALSSNFTLDVTMSPDFGLADDDPAEVNLTAFETFQPDRRQFFSEANNLLQFPAGGELNVDALFYSRRVGRSPQGSAAVAADAMVTVPTTTDVLGAATITGRSASGASVAVLEAVTGNAYAVVSANEAETKVPIEPLTNYLVWRAQGDIDGGQTIIGAMGTWVLRPQLADELTWLPATTVTGGFDIQHRWGGGNYVLRARLLGSHVSGEPEAIDRLQRAPARYLQRPDTVHLRYDPEARGLDGAGGAFELRRVTGSPLTWGIHTSVRTPGLELNDVGYLRTADQIRTDAWIAGRHPLAGGFLRTVRAELYAIHAATLGGELTEANFDVGVTAVTRSSWTAGLVVGHRLETVSTTALRGGPAPLLPARSYVWGNLSTDPSKPLTVAYRFAREVEPYGAALTWHNASVSWVPVPRLRIKGGVGARFEQNDIQYVDTVDDVPIVGFMDRTTVNLTAEVDYTLSPTLGVRVAVLPYFSAAQYGDYRAAANVRDAVYAERFTPTSYTGTPSFNVGDVRATAIARWEYRPSSTLSVIWSHTRAASNAALPLELGRDFDLLLDVPADNTLWVKLNGFFRM